MSGCDVARTLGGGALLRGGRGVALRGGAVSTGGGARHPPAASPRRGSRRPSARSARIARCAQIRELPAGAVAANRRTDGEREPARLDGKARIDTAACQAGVERKIDAVVEREQRADADDGEQLASRVPHAIAGAARTVADDTSAVTEQLRRAAGSADRKRSIASATARGAASGTRCPTPGTMRVVACGKRRSATCKTSIGTISSAPPHTSSAGMCSSASDASVRRISGGSRNVR